MKNLQNLVLVVFSLIVFFSSVPARGSVGLIAGGIMAESLVSNLIEGVNNVIANLENSASATSFTVRSDLIVVLDNLNQLADQVVGKTFGELNNSQQVFFQNTQKLIDLFEETSKVSVEQVDGVVLSMGEALSRIPGFKNRPFVTNYEPGYAIVEKNNLAIKIRGSLLANGTPELSFGNNICTIKTKTERSLEFQCASDIFLKNDAWVSGILNVTKPKSWYQFWKGGDEKFPYTVSVRTISPELGSYELKVFTKENTQTRNNRSQSNSHQNNYCAGNRSVGWNYSPASGCQIDVSSVNVTYSKSSQSIYSGVTNLTSGGFRVAGEVRNNGSCGPNTPFGHLMHDGRGNLNVTANWVDLCTNTVIKELPTENGTLFWKQQESFTLPANVDRFILTVHQINGEKKIVTGPSKEQWFSSDYDTNSKLLVFKPNTLDLALK